MMRMKSPCQYCEKREMGCHSSCTDYLDYVAESNDYNEKVRKARYDSNPFNSKAEWSDGQRRNWRSKRK